MTEMDVDQVLADLDQLHGKVDRLMVAVARLQVAVDGLADLARNQGRDDLDRDDQHRGPVAEVRTGPPAGCHPRCRFSPGAGVLHDAECPNLLPLAALDLAEDQT